MTTDENKSHGIELTDNLAHSHPTLPLPVPNKRHDDGRPKLTRGGLPEIYESSEALDYNNDGDNNNVNTPKEVNSVIAFIQDWLYTILIGFLVVSYWRGSWLLLDIVTCTQHPDAGLLNGESFCYTSDFKHPNRFQSAWITYMIGNVLLLIGVTLVIFWQPQIKLSSLFIHGSKKDDNEHDIGDTESTRDDDYNNNNSFTNIHKNSSSIRIVQKITILKAMIRFITIYILGFATVNIWHGIWYFIDFYIFPNDILFSSWFSTMIGLTLCYIMCAGASVLAPPAIFLLDGPSRLPPPITVTIIDSYRSLVTPVNDNDNNDSKKDPLVLWCIDIILSYIILPIGVVNYWRGCWYLMDWYLWGLTSNKQDLHNSILYSIIIGISCLFIGSDDIIQYLPTNIGKSQILTSIYNQTFGRLRTLILAIGAVNFWRAVWLVWDEFIGKSSIWSGVISHLIGIIGLLLLGCTSCIMAPPSTLGVDAIANEDCADEPLFHDVPIPSESLYLLAIGRQPNAILCNEKTTTPLVLFHDDYSKSSRFTQQSSSHIDRQKRTESYSGQILSTRNLMKRQHSQFFRSR